MPIDIADLNKLAYDNEERIRNTPGADTETLKGCYNLRETLAEIAKENGFVRVFNHYFKKPISNQSPPHKAHNGETEMKITDIKTQDLAVIIAGLVRENIGFRSYQSADGSWYIEMTGAF